MSEIAIADDPGALTPEWLTSALTGSGLLLDGVVVVAAELAPLGTGQMCDSWRVRLTYDGSTEAPSTLVAKLPAADETSRTTALNLRSYEKEVRFYQEVAPHLPLRTPRAYHADIDVATASFVLLLEDMAPAEQGDQVQGCSVDDAERATQALVGLHAPRWGDPGLTELDWLYSDPAQSRPAAAMFLPMLWDGFRDRYGAELPDHVHRAGEVLYPNIEAWTEPPADDARTIVHGDYRLDNLLFHPDRGAHPVTVVDWQTCAVGAAAADVAYFIGAGLHEAERREVEQDLARRYHEALEAAGVDHPWERFWRAYRMGTWAGLVMAVGASMLVERTERGDRMFMAMASRHARHALDLDAPELLLNP